jgi:hypothetical protein
MFSVGAGSSVTVQVPSPLSTASGPAAGSQPHQGPVIRTAEASEVTVKATPCAYTLGAIKASKVNGRRRLVKELALNLDFDKPSQPRRKGLIIDELHALKDRRFVCIFINSPGMAFYLTHFKSLDVALSA